MILSVQNMTMTAGMLALDVIQSMVSETSYYISLETEYNIL